MIAKTRVYIVLEKLRILVVSSQKIKQLEGDVSGFEKNQKYQMAVLCAGLSCSALARGLVPRPPVGWRVDLGTPQDPLGQVENATRRGARV